MIDYRNGGSLRVAVCSHLGARANEIRREAAEAGRLAKRLPFWLLFRYLRLKINKE